MSGLQCPVVGHERILRSLENAITAGQVSHAYIFSGPSGSGKSLIADYFAKALQCENGCGCGACASCRVFQSGNHPDVFYISPDGKSLGVDDVRDRVIKQMQTGPFRYRYKIFIIDSAHTLTVQAQNALLKTIEEPAAYGIFLLLAEGLGAFLPTVLSRCVVYKLEPLGYDAVYGYLKASGAEETTARLAAVYAQGNIGCGLQLAADTEFMEMRSRLIGIMNRIPTADLIQVFSIAKEFDAFKERIQEALDIMYLWYRDILVLRAAGPRFVIQADARGGDEVYAGLSAVWAARNRLRHYANFQLTIEVMLLTIWRSAGNTAGEAEGVL